MKAAQLNDAQYRSLTYSLPNRLVLWSGYSYIQEIPGSNMSLISCSKVCHSFP